MSYGKIIVKPEEKLRGLIPASFETYQIVEPGDIVIRSTDMQNDHKSLRTGLVKDKGIITSAYICLKSLRSDFSNFIHWQLHGLDLMKVLYGLGSGLRQNLSWNDFKRLPLPLPSLAEQRQISRYLDWQTSKINKFIKAKKKLIALLKEQRQNIINEAVTKGINPNVKMKDSGVEWLGEIPEHWNVVALKHFCRIQNGVTLGTNYYGGKFVSRPYLRVANVQNGYFLLEDIKNIEIPEQDVWRYELQFGDVLITEGGDLDKLGRGFVWESQINGCLHQNHIFAVRVNRSKLLPEFLSVILNTRPGREYFILKSKKTTNLASTNSTTVKAFLIPFLSISEQQSIVDHIAQETALINKTITRAEREIELIQEYRTRLVSDVVTGKIDVRSIKIPDFEPIEADWEVPDEEESEGELIAEGIEE